MAIRASQVTVGYGATVAVAGVDVVAERGQVVGLIGPNGSGKTTLLRALYRALTPSAGTITLDDVPIVALAPRQLARRLSVVTQEGAVEIPLTVREMVLLGRAPHRSAVRGYDERDHRLAADALRRVGCLDLAERSYGALSGGERQRVLIARSLAQQTEHLLLDEPTNHLDVHYQHAILQLVRELGVTAVVVLHDLNLAARYCDRLVLLDRGTLVAAGAPADVLTREVLEPVYRVEVRVLVDDVVQLLFRPPSAAGAPDRTAPARGG